MSQDNFVLGDILETPQKTLCLVVSLANHAALGILYLTDDNYRLCSAFPFVSSVPATFVKGYYKRIANINDIIIDAFTK